MSGLSIRPENELIALGHTYASHQHADHPPKWPILWTVPLRTIIHEHEPIEIPSYVENVVPGTELAVILNDDLQQSSKEEAAEAIRGFTVANDVMVMGEFPGFPYHNQEHPIGRGYHIFPTFSPLLAKCVPLDPDEAMDLTIRTYIDGDAVVEASTLDMEWTVPELISHVSQIVNLRGGDVISLGDPAAPKHYIDDAREVTCDIEKIGSLTNPVTRI